MDLPAWTRRPTDRSGPPAMTTSYVVRYGQMRFLGEFAGLPDREHVRGERVVVRSERGTEIGEVLTRATDRTALFLENPSRGEILRVASAEDVAADARLAAVRDEGFAACRLFIARRRLQQELVE